MNTESIGIISGFRGSEGRDCGLGAKVTDNDLETSSICRRILHGWLGESVNP